MSIPDFINGAFELGGGFFVALSVVKLHREKIVRGVSVVHVSFFLAWGLWNPFYYSGLEQWASFWGGIGLVSVNILWLGQMLYYNTINKPPVTCWQNEIDDDAAEAVGRRRMEPDQFGGFERTPRYRHADK